MKRSSLKMIVVLALQPVVLAASTPVTAPVGQSPDLKSNPAAEKLWNDCAAKFQKLKRIQADYTQISFPKDEFGDKRGHFDYSRSEKLVWKYYIFNVPNPRTIQNKTDGKEWKTTNSAEQGVERDGHKKMFHMMLYAMPLGPEFFTSTALPNRRPSGSTIRLGKDARIGGVNCRVLEIRWPNSQFLQRWYVGPDGIFRGHEFVVKQGPPREVTEMRLTNVKVER